ncbi:MAG: type I-C CRISPR-associated protein Cas7/Csd2, partial [Raoultibacter sp.]
LSDNRPRESYDGIGEISDVCIKRKLRNRMMDLGLPIFVQSDDRKIDGYKSLQARADGQSTLKQTEKEPEAYAKIACELWADVRSFGQLFAVKDKAKKEEKKEKGLSIGIRGPVSLHPAFSIAPIEIIETQITKSVNGTTENGRGSDTMGMKYRVDRSVYVLFGSISCQLAEKTGFTEEDAKNLHTCLNTLFENDLSSARPEGSMEVAETFWWTHNCKSGQYSTAQIHRAMTVNPIDTAPYYEVDLRPLDGLALDHYVTAV